MISQKINENSIRKAKTLIENANAITVICHTSPDGDAVGSSLAAMRVLSAIGKDVHVVVPDAFLFYLRALPGASEIVDSVKYPEFADKLIADTDLLLCLDFNEPSRVGRLSEALKSSKAPKILIDHHLNPSIDADVIISHPEMSSTCYLLFRFLCRLELFNLIDRQAAECILAGMMTDTGNFSYSCDDPELYIVEAELVRKGVDKAALYRMLFNTNSANCMRLNSYAILHKMELFTDAHLSLITLRREELNRFHYTKGDTEGLVNRPLAIPGIDISVFMRQESDCIRVSLRSVGDIPVNIIASELFGGGGHLNAAGGEYFGTLDEAAEHLKSHLDDIRHRFIDQKKK